MAATNANATMDGILGGILNQQVEEQDQVNAEQSEALKAIQAKTAAMQQAMLDRLMPKKPAGPQWTPQVVNIANALTVYPRLVPLVDAYVKKVVAAVNEATEKALADAAK